MALQVWLPLNGDLHNQGLNQNVTLSAVGNPTIENDGKIGKSYAFNGNSYFQSQENFLADMTECSLACWVKDTYTGNSWMRIFGIGEHTRVHLDTNGSGQVRFFVSKDGSTGQYWGPIGKTNLKDSTWHHVCGTFDSQTCKIYIDGKCEATVNTGSLPTATGGKLYLAHVANGVKLNGSLNDIRVYDHALSPKEVEDISKALILHYKLDNNGMGNENYWTNGQPQVDTWANPCTNELRTMIARTSASYVSYPTTVPNEYTEIKFLSTRKQIEDGGIQLQKMQRYNEDVNGMCPILENLNAGEYFTLSYELYVNSPVNVKFHISKRVNGTSSKVVPSIFQVSTVNTWTKISQSIQITSDFDKSNITAEVDFLGAFLSIQDILGVTTSDEVVIKVRNIKLERGQEATPWTPARADFGHVDDDIIYDYSGYGNNGTIVGNLTAATGSPRYDVYTNLTTTSTHIYTPALTTAGFANSFSISWWGNVSTYSGKMMWGFQDGNRLNGIYGGNLWNTGDSSSNPLYAPGTTTQVTAPTVNVWHHFVMTGDGSVCKAYKDGQLWAQAKTYKSLTGTIIYFNGWANATNYALANTKISDFRLYATALTADQVKELYQTSMLVDASGNIIPRGLED